MTDAYRARAAVSQSNLKHILRSPAHYIANLRNPPEPSKIMALGSAIHALLLEPNAATQQIAVIPTFGRSKADLDAKELWYIDNAGKIQITVEQMATAQAAVLAVSRHELAMKLLTAGRAEQPVSWTDSLTGIECKARPDVIAADARMIVDLKSCSDASLEEFQRSIARHGYHFQAAWYLDGVSQVSGQAFDQFVIVAVETTAPFGVAVYVIDHAAVEKGRELYRRALNRLAACQATDTWPAYDTEVQSIGLPAWAWSE